MENNRFLNKKRKYYAAWDLNKENILETINSLYPAIYLTVLSIIQGVSLSFWAYHLMNDFGLKSNKILLMLYAVITFTIIVYVFYEFVWSVLLYRWVFGLFDTVLLFLIGAGEILLTFLMETPFYWYMAASGLSVIGIMAYNILGTVIIGDFEICLKPMN